MSQSRQQRHNPIMRWLILALFMTMLLVGCKWGAEHRLPAPATNKLPTSVDDYKAYNKLGFELLFANDQSDENTLVSPVTTITLLTVLLNGSSGIAHDQLLAALNTKDENVVTFNTSQRALLNLIDSNQNRYYLAGSALWSIWPTVLDKRFIKDAGATNSVTVRKIGNTGIEAVRLVNEFASERTDGIIPTIVDHLDRDDQMFGSVVTSFAFDGNPFIPNGSMKFLGTEVDSVTVGGKLHTYTDARFACALVPLRNSGFELTIVIPKDETRLGDMQDVLNESAWSLLKASMIEAEIEVVLPALNLLMNNNIGASIKKIGISAIFDDRCNLRPMSIEMERGFHLSEVQTTSSFQLRSASGVRVERSKSYPIKLTADKPFFVAVSDMQTGAILLMGFVRNP